MTESRAAALCAKTQCLFVIPSIRQLMETNTERSKRDGISFMVQNHLLRVCFVPIGGEPEEKNLVQVVILYFNASGFNVRPEIEQRPHVSLSFFRENSDIAVTSLSLDPEEDCCEEVQFGEDDDSSVENLDSFQRYAALPLDEPLQMVVSSTLQIDNAAGKRICSLLSMSCPHTTLESMLLNPEETFADFEFHLSSESVTRRAHKSVLAARSPVFEAMFRNKMKESISATLTVENVSKNAFALFLRHIYLGTETNFESQEEAKQVVLLADFYALPHLKKQCLQAMRNMVTAENVASTLDTALSLSETHESNGVVERCAHLMVSFLVESRNKSPFSCNQILLSVARDVVALSSRENCK